METDPLLSSHLRASDEGDSVEDRIELMRDFNARLVISLFIDSVPVILSYILQNSIQTVAVLVAGRLGPNELSAAAFSYMLAFVTGECWCIALGGTTALDTFGSQAFTGGKRASDVSIHFERCLIVLWLLFIPVGVLWIFVKPALLALGQEERLSSDVQSVLRVLIIGAPGYIAFESLKKYLQCQGSRHIRIKAGSLTKYTGIMRLSTFALIIVSPINVALNLVLVHHTSFRLLGSPLALSLTYWLAFIILIVLTALSPQHKRNKTWGGLHLREALDISEIWRFLKLALPGILMVGTEWAAFEIVALAAGRLGALSLAAQSVIMTTDQILNTLPFGIGVAASARVGNLIGARSAYGAKHAGHASALLSAIVGAIVMATMLAARNVYGYIFSDDEEVVRLVSKVMPLVASFQVADGLAGSCGGVLRGLGRQHIGALFNLGAYYVLALPMGIGLAFSPRTHMGLQGLWVGQVVALFIVGIGLYLVVWRGTDWDVEVQNGIERNRADDAAKRRYEARVSAGESEVNAGEC
ncbi:MOP flippase [Fomitiporia mediterranea MF3/22]|uniref:MOP flippase n=1 Tax=Fomitiporia mediterranea (strain MF3/22) TaxID=694068 RepID=UPI000440731E|nr:MOP flippase [Fomitiporia mediterranea MF3/22]EJD02298.1 MOP flippase [Fomitiporia mediterranea MF3/22]